MPLMEAFEEGRRYVFAPSPAKKGQLGAIAIFQDGRCALELCGKTKSALLRKSAALAKILGAARKTLFLPETGGVTARHLYAGNPERILKSLCKAGYLTSEDRAHALIQCERLDIGARKKPSASPRTVIAGHAAETRIAL